MKTILTINDEFISILVFKNINNEPIVLFEDSISLDDSEIKMNFILDNTKFANKINQIISNASKFMNQDIKEVYLSFNVSKIDIDNFNSNINLPNKKINNEIWSKLNNIKIKQESDKQILSIDTISWNINGLNVFNLDRTYTNIDNINVAGKVFLMNKVLYDNIVSIFNNLNIKIIEFTPTLMSFNSLARSSEINNYEIVVCLNKENLNIVLLQGNHVINVFNYDIGIKALINEISTYFNINDYDKVYEILNDKNSLIFNTANNLSVGLDFNHETFKISEINISNMNVIIKEFINEITKWIIHTIKELKNNNINVSYLSLLCYNEINKYIFNKVKSNLNIDNNIINIYDEYGLDISQNLNLIYANNLILQDKKIAKDVELSEIKKIDHKNSFENKGAI